jgi:NhaA family Na+:H+ antiporter
MPRSARRPDPTEPVSPRALREFLVTEAAGGVLLVVATAIALVWANSPWQASYDTLWHTRLAVGLGRHELELDLRHWVNEGLMALFFLVVALEVKRELVLGELRDRRQAALPVAAAVGGMVVPALLYLAVNASDGGARGWGVPMATDIAFALGVLAVVARSIPSSVRLFLLTLAIVDDIGAIVVIALVYTSDLDVPWLGAAVAVFGVALAARGLGAVSTALFVALGIALWISLHASGVHATLAGVAMGLLVPTRPGLTREIVVSRAEQLLDVFSPEAARETRRIARHSVSQLEWLLHELHGWSSLVIVPLFALANAGVPLGADAVADAASSPVALGVLLGLVVGKLVGITGGAWLAIRLGVASPPDGATWRHLAGVAALGGIGFTVSLFITDLAFDDQQVVDEARIGILAASVLATVTGALVLRGTGPPGPDATRPAD